jgi:Fe2+ transport system protein B
MKVAKGIIGVVVSVILWFVFQVIVMFVLAALLVNTGFMGKLANWFANSKSLGHLFPVLMFGLPCILPAWVARKITASDDKLAKVTLCALAVSIIIINFALFWKADIITAIEAIIGIAGVHWFFSAEK